MYEIKLVPTASVEAALIHFWSFCFGDTITQEQFVWKCSGNPLGPGRAWIATENGTNEIVGAVLLYFREFVVNGETCRVLQLSDAAVHPSCRGKGVFTKLLNSAINTIMNENVAFGFAFPNESSAPAFRKHPFVYESYSGKRYVRALGGKNVASYVFRKHQYVQKAITPIANWLARSSGVFLRMRFALEPLKEFTAECEEWATECFSAQSIYPYRSAAYLNWKGCNCPSNVINNMEIYWILSGSDKIGYVILSFDDKKNIFKILDIAIKEPGANLAFAFETILAYAREKYVDMVVMNVSGNLFQNALRKAGFLGVNRYRVSFIDCHGYLKDKKESVNDLFVSAIDRSNYSY